MGQFYSNTICFTFIYSIYFEMCGSPFPLDTSLSTSPQRVLGPSAPGLMGCEYSLGLVFSQPVRGALERENSRKAAAAFLCLLDVTIMEICISEKRHSGPLGLKKYKYFNNKHVLCLPPVTAPGYYFLLNAVSQCQISYA